MLFWPQYQNWKWAKDMRQQKQNLIQKCNTSNNLLLWESHNDKKKLKESTSKQGIIFFGRKGHFSTLIASLLALL